MTTLVNPSYIKESIMKSKKTALSRSHQAIILMQQAKRFFESRQYKQALNYYTQVIDLGTTLNNLAYTLYMRGCAYEAVGNVEEACLDWNEAQELNHLHSLGVDCIQQALAKYQTYER